MERYPFSPWSLLVGEASPQKRVRKGEGGKVGLEPPAVAKTSPRLGLRRCHAVASGLVQIRSVDDQEAEHLRRGAATSRLELGPQPKPICFAWVVDKQRGPKKKQKKKKNGTHCGWIDEIHQLE